MSSSHGTFHSTAATLLNITPALHKDFHFNQRWYEWGRKLGPIHLLKPSVSEED
jgi:hypothetical protein